MSLCLWTLNLSYCQLKNNTIILFNGCTKSKGKFGSNKYICQSGALTLRQTKLNTVLEESHVVTTRSPGLCVFIHTFCTLCVNTQHMTTVVCRILHSLHLMHVLGKTINQQLIYNKRNIISAIQGIKLRVTIK